MLDFDEVCRVCLRNDQELLLIFDEKYSEGSTGIDTILREISKCEVVRFDELPQHICTGCLGAARNAYRFKRNCEKSYRHLMNLLAKRKSGDPIFSDDISVDSEYSSYEDEAMYAANLHLCEYCDRKFSSAKKLRTHRKNDHKNSEIVCRFCSEEFKRFVYLKSHLVTYHPEAGYKSGSECHICQQQFARKIHLIKHINVAHKDVNGRPNCESNFIENEDNTDISQIEAETDVKTEINSIEPIQSFLVKEEMKEIDLKMEDLGEEDSINVVSYDITLNESLYFEDMSEESFSSSWTDSKKIKIEELKTNSKQAFYCEDCNRTYANDTIYKRHRNETHNSMKIYNFRCRECAECFNSRKKLYAHKMSVGHCTLLCPECGLRCISKSALTVHMRRHTGEKPFKCKFCNKGFPGPDSLNRHEMHHTEEKNYFCKICGKAFYSKKDLNIHSRIHTGEKPYKCPHCSQAFSQQQYLTIHIRLHTGERLICEYCDAPFVQLYKLRNHKLTQHGIDESPSKTQRLSKFTSIKSQQKQIKAVQKSNQI